MANKQLTNLTAGIAISDADLFLTRQGANIEDTKVTGTQLQIYAQIGLAIGVDVQAWTAILEATTASFLIADETKLDGIETAATADQTGTEIKAAYETEPNAYTDTKDTKLSGIEAAATIDQTGAEIKSAYEAEVNAYTDTKDTKLAGIETAADVTDTANVDSVITKHIYFTFADPGGDLTTGDNKAYIIVDDELAGMDIISVRADVDSAPIGSTVTLQFHNVTSAQDILSTLLTIDATEISSSTAAIPAVIDTAQDDLTLGDKIRLDINAVGSGTAAKGLFVIIRCRTP